ncbi:hypothetical protein GA0115260_105031, partial [Streptomyces sp. MnatMP-M27]
MSEGATMTDPAADSADRPSGAAAAP